MPLPAYSVVGLDRHRGAVVVPDVALRIERGLRALEDRAVVERVTPEAVVERVQVAERRLALVREVVGAAAAVGPVRLDVDVAHDAEVLGDLDGRVLVHRGDEVVADDVNRGPREDLDRVVVRGSPSLVGVRRERHQIVDVAALEGRVGADLRPVDPAVDVEPARDDVLERKTVDVDRGAGRGDLDVLDRDVRTGVDPDDGRGGGRRVAAHDRAHDRPVARLDGEKALDVLGIDDRAVLGDDDVLRHRRQRHAGRYARAGRVGLRARARRAASFDVARAVEGGGRCPRRAVLAGSSGRRVYSG